MPNMRDSLTNIEKNLQLWGEYQETEEDRKTY
jgi:hypothetical protein